MVRKNCFSFSSSSSSMTQKDDCNNCNNQPTEYQKIAEPSLLAEFEFLLNIIDKFLFLHGEGHVEFR